ncbi:hypothetical protein F1654_01975 [Alkalicaulis satelles]|uniref:Uncharacterized protein n=1 Tax=Alkalicaulis satelles TaxID=2609175 RepID=A0A5M6ZJ06_9PROT|nr:hypothetical protein [Alkalicaulis satelles]KAA5804792.1 hypothetical protein F1654_01975 [Alkalicaulis satelles]
MPPASAHVIAFPSTPCVRTKPYDLSIAVQDWLDAQLRVAEHVRERLVADGADCRLIAILDQHAAFLREARSL